MQPTRHFARRTLASFRNVTLLHTMTQDCLGVHYPACLAMLLPSCSASALTQVINEQLGIAHGCITTVHNVTGTQPIIDMAMTKKKVRVLACTLMTDTLMQEAVHTVISSSRTCNGVRLKRIYFFDGFASMLRYHPPPNVSPDAWLDVSLSMVYGTCCGIPREACDLHSLRDFVSFQLAPLTVHS